MLDIMNRPSTLFLIFTFDIYIKYNFAAYSFTFRFSGFRVASFTAPFNSLVSRFETVWYGNRPSSEIDFAGCIRELEKLGCE